MNTPISIGLALLLVLMMPPGGPADAQERCAAASARDDGRPSMTGAFHDRRSAERTRSGSAVAARLVANNGFACGPDLTCNPATQYCAVVIGGPKGTAPGYSCVDLPDAAAPPTCERIAGITIGCACQQSNGGVTVTCAAP